ncbi:MAG: cupin domain-containing protein, partial [Bryobacteraceae bacterium]
MIQCAPVKLIHWNEVETEQLNPLLSRQVIHGDLITAARLLLKKGAVVPRHSHPNEQMTFLEKGRLRFVFDDGDVLVAAGETMQIRPGLPHGVEALEDSCA